LATKYGKLNDEEAVLAIRQRQIDFREGQIDFAQRQSGVRECEIAFPVERNDFPK
jgi:hypothetical protein